MKHKLLALILALTVVSWAQEATQTAPATPQQSTEKAKCSCCDNTASADAKSCCGNHDHAMASGDMKGMSCSRKDGKSCCGGKDAKSCMKGENGQSCCKDCGKDKTASSCCGGKCEKGCCKKMEKAGMNCCHGDKRG